jgi:hypothetical protein
MITNSSLCFMLIELLQIEDSLLPSISQTLVKGASLDVLDTTIQASQENASLKDKTAVPPVCSAAHARTHRTTNRACVKISPSVS